MTTGQDLAQRLIVNISTSLELRSRIPDMATLKDLAEGGARLNSQMLNTSSNFGSFDKALNALLKQLHDWNDHIMPASETLPLPLTEIKDHLSDQITTVARLLQEHLDLYELTNRLETINAAAV